VRTATSGPLEQVELQSARVGFRSEPGAIQSSMRSQAKQRIQMIRGAAIAVACGILVFAGSLLFLSVTAPVTRTIHVRWIPGTSAEQRGEREQRLGLEQGELAEGRTWVYEIREPTAEELKALVRDEMVEDTHGFDRETLELPPSRTARRAFPFGLWTAIVTGIALLLRGARNRLIRWSR